MNKGIRKITMLLCTLMLINIFVLGNVFASYQIDETKIKITLDNAPLTNEHLGKFKFALKAPDGTTISSSIYPRGSNDLYVNTESDASTIGLFLSDAFDVYIRNNQPAPGTTYLDFTLEELPTDLPNIKTDPKVYNIRLFVRLNEYNNIYYPSYVEVNGSLYDPFGAPITLGPNGNIMTNSDKDPLFFLFNNTTIKYTSRTVNKVWKNGSETSIQAQLYQDGLAYGAPVELNAANGWTYTWTNLDDSYNWTVKEFSVPAGYKLDVETSVDGSVTTLTNTKLTSPSIPPANTVKASPVNTGDSSDAAAWFMMFSTSLLCICFAVSIKLRKQTR